MSLNLGSPNTDFDNWIKFNSKAGRWYIKKDEQEVEVPNPTFVADFANIKTGWFKFSAGMAPDKVFDKSLSEAVARPSEEHRRGFEVRLFSKSAFGGVVVLSGASMHLNNAISEVYAAYEQGLAANPGKLPVIKCTGTTPMKDKQGTNYRPVLVLEKWVDRPADFDTQAAAPVAAAKPAPAPVAVADDNEF